MALRRSRTLRKFLRHKPALAAAVVIAFYAGLAGLIMLTGFVSVEDTNRRVGAMNQAGFGWEQTPEERLEQAEWLIDRIDGLLGRRDPEAALSGFSDMGIRRPADVSPAELQSRVDAAWETYDQIAEVPDIDSVLSEGWEPPADYQGPSPDELRGLLADLEGRTDGLLKPLSEEEQGIRSRELLLGTDRQGRSVFWRAVYSVRVAVLVGAVTGFLAVLLGTIAGLSAGYFGGWVDHAVTWVYSMLASVPNIILLILLAFIFDGGYVDETLNEWTGGLLRKMLGGQLNQTLVPLVISFTLTYWIGPCRVIRGEAMKLKELEYVQAARALGFGQMRILLRHILPNVMHLMLINFSLLFIGAIKSEVILSFLGLGVQDGASWGLMISQSKAEVVNGFFWQIGSATAFMFVLVLAFNVLSDAMQDILDPRHVDS